jgi:ATP-dependent Zn protease
MKSINRVRRSYHEAGHAVAMLLLGEPLASVTIIPNAVSGGCAVLFDDDASSDPSKFFYQRHLIIGCAGAAAEKKSHPKAHVLPGWGIQIMSGSDSVGIAEGSDIGRLIALAERLGAHDEEAICELLGLIAKKTKILIRKNWPAIESVAKALREKSTLTGVEVVRIIGPRRCWRAVGRMPLPAGLASDRDFLGRL